MSQLGCIFFDILLVYNCFAWKSLSLLISKDFLAYLLNGCVKEYRFPNNATLKEHLTDQLLYLSNVISYPARALRALGLLLADGTPTGGRGEDFLNRQPDFFTETAVTPERKVEKSFPRWEINRHVEG